MRFVVVLFPLLFLLACQQQVDVAGRWDVTVGGADHEYPSWFALEKKDGQWQGNFVGESGHARPIESITLAEDQLTFSLSPLEWEGDQDLRFVGTIMRREIRGIAINAHGDTSKFSAIPAPEMPCNAPDKWNEPIDLIRSGGVENWTFRNPDSTEGWRIQEEELINTPPSADLISKAKFSDFKLHIEVKVPERGNSGIYLRGRYEIQVMDQQDRPVSKRSCGSIYGHVAPSENAFNPAGEWNIFDITMIGRCVTIELNGKTIIDHQEIPGITGGALNSSEGEPGPLMLQGDHGSVSYRNIIVTPAI